MDTNLTETVAKIPLDKAELQIVQAKLLAAIARADGKVLQIENLVAEFQISSMGKSELDQVKQLYLSELDRKVTAENLAKIIDVMKRARFADRMSLIKMLSAIAVSDGELHPDELQFIKSTMNSLKVDHVISVEAA